MTETCKDSAHRPIYKHCIKGFRGASKDDDSFSACGPGNCLQFFWRGDLWLSTQGSKPVLACTNISDFRRVVMPVMWMLVISILPCADLLRLLQSFKVLEFCFNHTAFPLGLPPPSLRSQTPEFQYTENLPTICQCSTITSMFHCGGLLLIRHCILHKQRAQKTQIPKSPPLK